MLAFCDQSARFIAATRPSAATRASEPPTAKVAAGRGSVQTRAFGAASHRDARLEE
jgi:hypothetical protein|tara:strand:+ start:10505 stop:10672 length:168 start_codon:yes stop_codon:yes gene_type:complete